MLLEKNMLGTPLPTNDMADDDAYLDDLISNFVQYWRGVVKAVLIAIMMMVAIHTASGSLSKSLFFGAIIFLIACFNTWRRYLQSISFVLFLATLAYICVDFSMLPKFNLFAK